MKVHVVHGDGRVETFVASTDTPMVAVTLEDQDKLNVANMHPDCTVYSMYDSDLLSITAAESLLDQIKGLTPPAPRE